MCKCTSNSILITIYLVILPNQQRFWLNSLEQSLINYYVIQIYAQHQCVFVAFGNWHIFAESENFEMQSQRNDQNRYNFTQNMNEIKSNGTKLKHTKSKQIGITLN